MNGINDLYKRNKIWIFLCNLSFSISNSINYLFPLSLLNVIAKIQLKLNLKFKWIDTIQTISKEEWILIDLHCPRRNSHCLNQLVFQKDIAIRTQQWLLEI